MDDQSQLERELENEIDAMPPIQDNDETENSELVNFSDEDEEPMYVPPNNDEQVTRQQQESRQQHRNAVLQRMQQSPVAGDGGVGTETIEIMSSDDEDDSESDDDDQPTAAILDDSSDDEEGAMVVDSDSDENDLTSDGESEDGQENKLLRSFAIILAGSHKEFAQLVKLTEIAFKLNDLDKIEVAVEILKSEAHVPAHIWLKYLKARKLVTHTAQEIKDFEAKCATALSYHYNIPLAEYIVGYLEDLAEDNQNRMLWLKLMADYEIERPDFIEKLTTSYKKLVNDTEAEAAFKELMEKHCVTGNIPAEQRQIIKEVVSEFKKHLENTKAQFNDWDWAKVHTKHVKDVLALNLSDDLKNAIIRFIFERLVAKFPTADALWLAYMKFTADQMDEDDEENAELKAKRLSRLGKGFLLSTALDLVKRAVRCRPSVRLNHKLLVLMERADFDQTQVDEEINILLKRIERDMLMTVELYLDYLAYRIRNTNASDEAQVENLRAAFFKVWEDLSNIYGDQADTSYEILQLWAQVEFTHLANPANGSRIWRQIMGYPGSSERGTLWISYAQMESEYNGGQAMREILREALSQEVLLDGQLVHEHFRRYERCYGTYESIAACQSIELPPDYERRVYSAPRQNRLLPRPKQSQDKPEHEAQLKSETQAAKAPLNRQQRRRQAHDFKTGNTEQQQQQQQAKKAAEAKPQAKPAAFEVRETHLKYSLHLETNKVFVRNLHPACTKEELEKLFNPFGHVKDVRLVRKQKQMRGIAYIEYDKPEEAQKAVTELNGYELHGIKLMVAISNPPPKAGQTQPAASGDGGSAPRKRVLTSLIPTSVARQEAVVAKKRRIELAQNQDNDPQPSTSADFNGKKATVPAGSETEKSTQKSNDDFRKLFLKETKQGDTEDKTMESIGDKPEKSIEEKSKE